MFYATCPKNGRQVNKGKRKEMLRAAIRCFQNKLGQLICAKCRKSQFKNCKITSLKKGGLNERFKRKTDRRSYRKTGTVT